MNKENIPVITDREELYDKCENMEQLFDKYYLPLLYKHYSKVYELQQENKRLKIQVSAREEVANKYKKVIDETRHYVEKECNDLLIGYFHNRFDTTEYYEKLLQILDKGESNE